jgi:hypothetical protein
MDPSMDNEELFLMEGEDITPEQKKRVAFAIGRFQPPTAGHYKVIDKMVEFIRKNKDLHLEATPVVVIIEGKDTGKDTAKNPLTVDERIRYMKNSGRANSTIFLSAPNAFAAFAAIREAGFEPIAIGAGTDRAGDYKRILDKYFTTPEEKPIKHVIVPGLDRSAKAVIDTKGKAGRLDKSLEDMKASGSLDEDEISGSLARRAAELDYFDEFVKIVGQEKNLAAAKQMYKKIRAGITKAEQEK